MDKFIDRHDAGIILAKHLKNYANNSQAIVLALPRGGVPVAYEIAKSLNLPLDVFIVRKLGVPGHEELAMGALATGGVIIFNEEIINSLNLSKASIERVIQSEQKELERRELTYRGSTPPPTLKDKTLILVDDGIATGATMQAALKALNLQKPKQIIVAVPVAALSSFEDMKKHADKVICLMKPINFYAVGLWYIDFTQTTDNEVSDLLRKRKQNNVSSTSSNK